LGGGGKGGLCRGGCFCNGRARLDKTHDEEKGYNR